MSFNLQILFEGLCVYVPHDSGNNTHGLRILMGQGSLAYPHVCTLSVLQGNVSAAPNRYNPDTNSIDLNNNDLTISSLPDDKVNLSSSFFSQIADLSNVGPFFGTTGVNVNTATLSNPMNSNMLIARLRLTGGSIGIGGETTVTTFQQNTTVDPESWPNITLSSYVVYNVTMESTNFTMSATNWNQALQVTPVNNIVEIKISNSGTREQTDPGIDQDFLLVYSLTNLQTGQIEVAPMILQSRIETPHGIVGVPMPLLCASAIVNPNSLA